MRLNFVTNPGFGVNRFGSKSKRNCSILAPGAGHGFRQNRVDFIQYLALIGTLRKNLVVDTVFAGAFHQVADFKIVFVFECFFLHLDMFKQVEI